MKRLYKNLHIYIKDGFVCGDILTEDGAVAAIFPAGSRSGANAVADGIIIEFNTPRAFAFPGLVDVHTHLREPGFSYKETIRTGTLAAAHGGFTEILAMPNVSPAPDKVESLRLMTDIIERDAVIGCTPYGTITVGRAGRALSDMEALSPHVAAFSDDGDGVADAELMKEAMLRARALDKIIAAHCEIKELAAGGVVHKGEYASALGVPGISSESEWRHIERDLSLAAETGCKYHVCHVSCGESVELIRKAKSAGIDVTCETAPHYLTLTDADVKNDGRYKMNPPLRSLRDREALLAGISDGTIDMIATDHAPHSSEEKSRGLSGSPFGITGLECSFPVLYTHLVRTGIITLERLIYLMHDAPAARFGVGTDIDVGSPADFTVFELESEYSLDPSDFLSLGKSTPYDGARVYGSCLYTVCHGRPVWQKSDHIKESAGNAGIK